MSLDSKHIIEAIEKLNTIHWKDNKCPCCENEDKTWNCGCKIDIKTKKLVKPIVCKKCGNTDPTWCCSCT